MKYKILKSEDRGNAYHGWLKTFHSFSFSNYYDKNRIHFGALRVFNDDYIESAMGFGKHPHSEMEIITIPLSGSLKHEDSMGNSFIIKTGDIQVMSAGKGVFHSEINASNHEPVELLQIWIIPNQEKVEPRYQQISFENFENQNHLLEILSPYREENKVWIYQDAWISIGNFKQKTEVNYEIHKENNGLFIFIIEGEVQFDHNQLSKRDSIEIENIKSLNLTAEKNSKILLIEIPMLV